MHTHNYRPVQADGVRSRIRMRCGCWRAAVRCEPCAERLETHRVALLASVRGEVEHPGPRPEPGCEGCYRGLKLKRAEPGCCCSRARSESERCENCRPLPRGIHVCLVETEAEINHTLYVKMGAPVAKHAPTKEMRDRVKAMEQATQLRAPRLYDR